MKHEREMQIQKQTREDKMANKEEKAKEPKKGTERKMARGERGEEVRGMKNRTISDAICKKEKGNQETRSRVYRTEYKMGMRRKRGRYGNKANKGSKQ